MTSGSGHEHRVLQTCRTRCKVSTAITTGSFHSGHSAQRHNPSCSGDSAGLDRWFQILRHRHMRVSMLHLAGNNRGGYDTVDFQALIKSRKNVGNSCDSRCCSTSGSTLHAKVRTTERGSLLGLAAPGVCHKQSSVVGQQNVLHLLLCSLIHI